jgi:Holliday junction resolvasome RuvABC ATP-dependent DNA helicase subunit
MSDILSQLNTESIGIENIKIAVSATKVTAKLLEKYKKVTPKLPLTVPHLLVYGAPGTGKTRTVEQAASLMGCDETSFIRISADCISKVEDLVTILEEKLSWQGYLCNCGKTDHTNCPTIGHYMVDPVTPISPVKPQLVFFDEIHILSKDLQEKLGLIILDFKYQLAINGKLRNIFFPRFTFAGATTKPGDLLKPLRTRFGLKINIPYHSDEKMVEISRTIAKEIGVNLEDQALETVAKISQGIPREAVNHIKGTINYWIHCLEQKEIKNKEVITNEVVKRYIKLQQFLEDGLSYEQIRVLQYLSNFVRKDKISGAGVSRLCSALSMDNEKYLQDIEPRLLYRNLIVSGNRGREITSGGMDYLSKVVV